MTVIAMTREIGSHGSEVAAGVAAELGLEIINSEIAVPHIAGSLRLGRRMASELDQSGLLRV
jgi:hypothetical protein